MLRLGIVDFDSSHCIEFTRRYHHVGAERDQFVDGARVTCAWTGASDMSPERVPRHAEQLAACGVRIVDQLEDMPTDIDGVLVLSLCGAQHADRVARLLPRRIPIYVDKPLACTITDARHMISLAEQQDTLIWSSSAMRFSHDVIAFQAQADRFGTIHGISVWGPARRAALNPGLFHYGIHTTELLFTLMGPGCQQVATTYSTAAESVTATWSDDRIGTLRGIRDGSTAYGFTAFCEHGIVHQQVSTRFTYRNLCREIVSSFATGKAPVPVAESLEIVAFVTASLASESHGGVPVKL